MNAVTLRILSKWLIGGAISLVLVWAITAVCTENIYSRIWSEKLNRNVPAQGWSFHNRGEAWAKTTFGELGLPGTEKIADSSVPKVLIWGDSFVEAFQVAESKRMHRQLNGLLASGGGPDIQVVGIGRRFQSFADYIFQIPVYEKVIQPCQLHIIHLHTLDDVYPDRNPADRISLFLTEPELHFERYDNEYREIEVPSVANPIKELVYRGRGQFFLSMKKRMTQIVRLEGMRFSPGSQSLGGQPLGGQPLGGQPLEGQPGKLKGEARRAGWHDYLHPEWASRAAPVNEWEFAIDTLKSITNIPVLIVYAPATPALDRGVVVIENPEEELAREFEKICQEKGVGFVNLDENFQEFFRNSGGFPRGFQTSRPWEGHYNEEGHRIVAEAMNQWIEEHAHVVHPD